MKVTMGDFTSDLDFRWAKAKAERWSLYLDQSSTKLWSESTDLIQND